MRDFGVLLLVYFFIRLVFALILPTSSRAELVGEINGGSLALRQRS